MKVIFVKKYLENDDEMGASEAISYQLVKADAFQILQKRLSKNKNV